jgi:hypothetical protein
MDRKRLHKGFAFAAGWVAVLIGFFAFGERTARPALPTCTQCPCKNVTFWRITGPVDLGAFVPGATNPKTQQTTYGIIFLMTTGGCNNTPDTQNGTFDRYQCTGISPICTVGGVSAYPIEDSISNINLFGWVAGSGSLGLTRYVCAP